MQRIDEPIIVEELFDRDIDSVWAAITEPEQMRQWFFDNMPAFEPMVGFEVEFNVDAGGRVFLHQWRVTKVIPRRFIEYNWRYGDYKGDALVSFELSQQNELTKLRLTHTITDNFQKDVPEFKRESCIGGWRHFINGRLKAYLAH